MTTIAPEKALDLLRSFHGHIFAADFIKKDGTVRRMVARMGVRKAKGTGTYSHTACLTRANATVFDMALGEYRAIPLDRVLAIRHAGETYIIGG
jgi:hypothetical protein